MLQLFKIKQVEELTNFEMIDVLNLIDQMNYKERLEIVGRAINRLTDKSSIIKLTKKEKEVVARFLQNKMEELNELVKD